jgi:hypothetical protein
MARTSPGLLEREMALRNWRQTGEVVIFGGFSLVLSFSVKRKNKK